MLKSCKYLLPLVLLTFSHAFAQDLIVKPARTKGTFYITWGYHRDQYTNSTIHFKGHAWNDGTPYDFTFHHAKAKDQPDFHDLLNTALSVPQYVFNVGYFFNDKHDLGIEVSWDHLKYVVVDNQMMHVTGYYKGMQHNVDTVVTPNFVHYEHTNGNNYLMVSLVKRKSLFKSARSNRALNAVFKAGAGLLDPKTESVILGTGGHNDGPFRISGIVFGASAGLRYNIFKYFYVEGTVKCAYADYTSVKLYGDGRATQQFGSIQYIWAAGASFPL